MSRLKQILLIEDAEPDVFLVREALKEAGLDFELRILDDGEKAVEYFDRLDANAADPSPDVVLLDLNLPKVSGDQVLERLRRSPRCTRLPVIVVTSSDTPADKMRAARLGATRYFRKPSALDQFMQLGRLVRDLLETSAG
jgi:CheY-like chemotaxis protein